VTDPTEQEVALLTAALNHAWEIFNFRVASALQILNYYIVTVAILAGAYVGALTQGLPGVAASIGLGGSVVSAAAFYGGYAQVLHARSAAVPLGELENKVTLLVKVTSFASNQVAYRHARYARLIASCMFIVAFVSGLVASAYAILHR
jgi:hypothetical protein